MTANGIDALPLWWGVFRWGSAIAADGVLKIVLVADIDRDGHGAHLKAVGKPLNRGIEPMQNLRAFARGWPESDVKQFSGVGVGREHFIDLYGLLWRSARHQFRPALLARCDVELDILHILA